MRKSVADDDHGLLTSTTLLLSYTMTKLLMMKKLTVKKFVEMIGNKPCRIECPDTNGVWLEMSNATICFDTDFDELSFQTMNGDGISKIAYKVDEVIKNITVNEELNIYTIKFSQNMADIEVRVEK